MESNVELEEKGPDDERPSDGHFEDSTEGHEENQYEQHPDTAEGDELQGAGQGDGNAEEGAEEEQEGGPQEEA